MLTEASAIGYIMRFSTPCSLCDLVTGQSFRCRIQWAEPFQNPKDVLVTSDTD